MSEPVSNLLVVSDLHLGGALRGRVGWRALRVVVRLDRELSRFLAWHRRNPLRNADGSRQPWTLILNGDTFDFLHIDLRPDAAASGDATPPPFALGEEETRCGLEFNESRARWKLGQIARYHRRCFRALARFVDEGHRLVFVVGNHDVDLFYAGVRQDLLGHLAGHARDPEGLRSRVHLEPWFYYEPGRAYIEHGHRFDPYATFPDPLSPLSVDGRRELGPNFSHFGLRFFCNRVPSFPLHDVDTWGAKDYLRWAFYRAGQSLARVTLHYSEFIWRYAGASIADRVGRERDAAMRRQRRRERLRRFARKARLPMERIVALDALRLPHVGSSLWGLAQGLYLDRALLALAAVAGVALASEAGSTLGVVATLALTLWAWMALARSRPTPDVHPILGGVARRIGRLTGAPVVVFGHTHRPTLTRLGRVRWLNPGSWEHLPRCRHKARACACHAQFAVISGAAERTRAVLYRWIPGAAAPVPVHAD